MHASAVARREADLDLALAADDRRDDSPVVRVAHELVPPRSVLSGVALFDVLSLSSEMLARGLTVGATRLDIHDDAHDIRRVDGIVSAPPRLVTLDDRDGRDVQLRRAGGIPVSPLPVIVYHGVSEAHDASTCEKLFAKNGWLGAWWDGIYDFDHFRSTAHEVLGIVRGRASVILAGQAAQRFELGPGDVAVLPAGSGHCNAGSSSDLLVVGDVSERDAVGHPYGDPGERGEVPANIASVPIPAGDPVQGDAGPLVEMWGGPERPDAG